MKLTKSIILLLKNELRNKQAMIFSIILPLVILFLTGTTNKSNIPYEYPGIVGIAFGVMGIVGISSQLVKYINNGVLKRIQITDDSLSKFYIVDYIVQIFFMILQFIIITLCTKIFYNPSYNITKRYLPLILFVFLLTMTLFISLGILVAAFSRNSRDASTVSNVIMMIMLFIGNALFPLNNFPKILMKICKYLPMNLYTEIMHHFLNNDLTNSFIINHIIYLLLWNIFCMITGIILLNIKIKNH
nr:ABC transporter permease [uncultured Ligilactobacillus sp.]